VDTKVLEKHTTSICTLILKMEAAGTSKMLAVTMSQCSKYHLHLLPASPCSVYRQSTAMHSSRQSSLSIVSPAISSLLS